MEPDTEAVATLTGVLSDLQARGYVLGLRPVEHARLATDDGAVLDANEVKVDEWHRLFGPSDPEDEAIVAAVRWTSGGETRRGVVVLGFGPTASREDLEVLERLRNDHAPTT